MSGAGHRPRRKPFRIHGGTRSAAEFRRLIAELDAAIEAEAQRLERGEEPQDDFDRQRIGAAFARAGFTAEDFDLDLGAPIEEFLPCLEDLYTDDLPIIAQIYERYPSGVIDPDTLTPLQDLLEELGFDEDA